MFSWAVEHRNRKLAHYQDQLVPQLTQRVIILALKNTQVAHPKLSPILLSPKLSWSEYHFHCVNTEFHRDITQIQLWTSAAPEIRIWTSLCPFLLKFLILAENLLISRALLHFLSHPNLSQSSSFSKWHRQDWLEHKKPTQSHPRTYCILFLSLLYHSFSLLPGNKRYLERKRKTIMEHF